MTTTGQRNELAPVTKKQVKTIDKMLADEFADGDWKVESEAGAWSKDLVKQIAMDIGKETVAYIEVMYPKAIEATSSTFKLAIRNHIYNQIMAAIEVTDEGKIIARLADRLRSTPCAVPEGLLKHLAVIPLWQDAYPDGPDIFCDKSLSAYFVTNDVRTARKLLAAGPPAPAVHDGAKPAEKEGWEPISTAPKDGTKIDICSVYEASYGPPQVFLHRDAQWRHGGWHDFGWNNINWRNEPDDPDEPGSWASRRAFCWRPVPVLPAPPVQGDR